MSISCWRRNRDIDERKIFMSYTAFDTLLIHGGTDGDKHTGSVTVPIYQTSTFQQDGLGELREGWEYSRTGNPTRAALENLIAQLEGGEAGFAFASGMAAITAVLSLFRSGDKILLSSNVYGGTFRVLDKVFSNFGLSYSLEDTVKLAGLEEKFTPEVKAIIIESPANPLLSITDIRAVSEIAHRHGALVIVDNTFMTPYLQKPLVLGADIVVHSATKYLGGHSDLVAGLVVTKTKEQAEQVAFIQNSTGAVLGPQDAFLLIRGIKTLGVRLDRHVENAKYLAEWLEGSTEVKKVYYPGFKDSPGHEVIKKQARGFGSMITFEVDSKETAYSILENVRLIHFAESLGGVETLITYPVTQTHADVPEEIRLKNGITDSILRLSVGVENGKDLIAEFERVFA